MLRWVVGIAVLMTLLALAARLLQLGLSLALLGVAAVAGVIAVVLAIITWQRRGEADPRG